MVDDQEFIDPLRNLTMELTQKYVKEAVKEAIKQAIRKQGVKLSKSQFNKFEDKINNLSDQEKIEKLKEPLEEVKHTITREGINERSLAKLTDTLNKGLDSKIALGMALGVKAGMIAIISCFILVAGFYIFMPGNGEAISEQYMPIITGNNSTLTCSECNGTGYIKCPYCGGKEIASATIQTLTLNPESQVQYPVKPICNECDDTGKIICPKCGGDGKLNPGDPGYV